MPAWLGEQSIHIALVQIIARVDWTVVKHAALRLEFNCLRGRWFGNRVDPCEICNRRSIRMIRGEVGKKRPRERRRRLEFDQARLNRGVSEFRLAYLCADVCSR